MQSAHTWLHRHAQVKHAHFPRHRHVFTELCDTLKATSRQNNNYLKDFNQSTGSTRKSTRPVLAAQVWSSPITVLLYKLSNRFQSTTRPCNCHYQELGAVIDDWLQMTTTSSGVYSGQIALVSLPLLPPFLPVSLWREMVHMAGSLVSGWLEVPRDRISLADWQLNKQTGQSWSSCLPRLPSNR